MHDAGFKKEKSCGYSQSVYSWYGSTAM